MVKKNQELLFRLLRVRFLAVSFPTPFSCGKEALVFLRFVNMGMFVKLNFLHEQYVV